MTAGRVGAPRYRGVLVAGVVSLALAACGSAYPQTQIPPLPRVDQDPGLYQPQIEDRYRIAPGDTLLVHSYYDPTLRQSVVVRPDGRISLTLLGEVSAVGKTPDELRHELMPAYARYLAATDVTVTVSATVNQVIYVGGAVGRPSMLAARGQLTMLQAIIAAGGFTELANSAQVLLLRAAANGHYRVLQQNVDAVLHNRAGELYLRRRDVIYVPKTAIAQADEFVQHYINQIIPHAVLASFGYGLSDETYGLSNGSSSR